jgi:hypothetical protein
METVVAYLEDIDVSSFDSHTKGMWGEFQASLAALDTDSKSKSASKKR